MSDSIQILVMSYRTLNAIVESFWYHKADAEGCRSLRVCLRPAAEIPGTTSHNKPNNQKIKTQHVYSSVEKMSLVWILDVSFSTFCTRILIQTPYSWNNRTSEIFLMQEHGRLNDRWTLCSCVQRGEKPISVPHSNPVKARVSQTSSTWHQSIIGFKSLYQTHKGDIRDTMFMYYSLLFAPIKTRNNVKELDWVSPKVHLKSHYLQK